MIKQVVFVVCAIVLIFCTFQVLGYMGDGFTSITSKVTDMTSQFGSLIEQITGFANTGDPSSLGDDPTKTLEDIQSLGGKDSALGSLLNDVLGIKI